MKKLFTSAIIPALCLLISTTALNAQNSLQFVQAKLIDNNLQTVPVGKVWKVVSVYGSAPRICVSHPKATSTSNTYSWFNVQGFLVNSITVFSEATFAGSYSTSSGHMWYTTDACSTVGQAWDNKAIWGIYDISPNPNILPMWLPAGTTLQAMQGSVISVIEFEII